MKYQPLISVYMPTSNRLQMLRRAVASVVAQDYENWELIVVDDCSNDGTREFLESLSDSRVRSLHHHCALGACASRNWGIREGVGEFITGLDDDDYFRPNRLSQFVDSWALLEPEREFGFLFDHITRKDRAGERVLPSPVVADVATLLGSNCIGSQVFCRRDHLVKAGMFHPALPAWQDWDTWVRLARLAGPGLNIRTATYVMDESHDFGRISQRPAFILRYAMELFCHRNGPLTNAQRASIIYNYSKYAQVRLTPMEWVKMMPMLLSRRIFWSRLGSKFGGPRCTELATFNSSEGSA